MNEPILDPANLPRWTEEFRKTSNRVRRMNHPDAQKVSMEYLDARDELLRLQSLSEVRP